MDDLGTLTKRSEADRLYAIRRLNRQARSMRLEAARAATGLAAQLIALASSIEAEAKELESAAAN